MNKNDNNLRASIMQVLLGLTEACKEENALDLSELLLLLAGIIDNGEENRFLDVCAEFLGKEEYAKIIKKRGVLLKTYEDESDYEGFFFYGTQEGNC